MSAEGGRVESQRDQTESQFTQILRRFWNAFPTVLGICFVDGEGECIDYCTSLDPYDIKIVGAQMRVVDANVESAVAQMRAGHVRVFDLYMEKRRYLLHRIDCEYILIVVLDASVSCGMIMEALEETVNTIRAEAGLKMPSWPVTQNHVYVDIRPAVGWGYAPLRLYDAGEVIEIVEVLGRWCESESDEPNHGQSGDRVCFRVRAEEGRELTLSHETISNQWTRL